MDVATLDLATVDRDPMRQFATWYEEGVALDIVDANAMTLATASKEGIPSARMVLLKSFDERGFVFFSNYESRKAREMDANPSVALVLFWSPLRRQIRIEGRVERVPRDESDAYFASRPRGSQIAALASRQSAPLSDRAALEERAAALDRELMGRDVPRPDYWGGYRARPIAMEFWQGRRDRLHDRVRYARRQDGSWTIELLAP